MFAKILGKTPTFVTKGKDGWVGPDGKPVKVLASPKRSKFYKDAAEAAADGHPSAKTAPPVK